MWVPKRLLTLAGAGAVIRMCFLPVGYGERLSNVPKHAGPFDAMRS